MPPDSQRRPRWLLLLLLLAEGGQLAIAGPLLLRPARRCLQQRSQLRVPLLSHNHGCRAVYQREQAVWVLWVAAGMLSSTGAVHESQGLCC
jgi:hypothetical protein